MAVSGQDPRHDTDTQRTEHAPPPAPAHHQPETRRGLTAVLAAAMVVVVAVGLTVPPSAPAHQLLAPATVADPQAQAAIQTVIQQANSEQARALTTNNPALMTDTTTAAYYRQLVQTNEALAAQGATSMDLVQLTWGPTSINGSTATATTTETWTTAFSDGTTTQSTNTNFYTLVQQGGAWLIESDQSQAATSSPSPQSTPVTGGQAPPPGQPAPQAPLPAVSVGAKTSHNWSGYAATSGTYTGVSGTWNVPQPRLTGAAGVGATWVGIGGVTTHDLIQAGTQDATPGGGQGRFETWIEMLPQASQQVPLAVEPGHSVTVSINERGPGTGLWQISMKNNTTGQTYQTTVSYASSESSAEWVEEAPTGARGVLPLDNFNSVSFSAASAVENGLTVDLAQTGAQPITMINGNNQPLAVASPVGSNGSSFSVARTSAPATTTAPGGPGRGPAGAEPPPGQ